MYLLYGIFSRFIGVVTVHEESVRDRIRNLTMATHMAGTSFPRMHGRDENATSGGATADSAAVLPPQKGAFPMEPSEEANHP
jgi:hypothetical protein